MTLKMTMFCPWPKVFIFGDSHTECSFSNIGCWGNLLANFLQRKCDVMVRGFAGYTSRECKMILPTYLDTSITKDVVAMTVLLGSNDANDKVDDSGEHVSQEEYEQNLKEIISIAKSQGISPDKVILITPPAFHIDLWSSFHGITGHTDNGRKNELTALYSKSCLKVAQEMGARSVDLYTEMMKTEDFSTFLSDGLHLSDKGSKLLFDLLKPIIIQLTSHLPIVWFPFHDQVDVNNLDKSLLSCN